MFLSLFVRLFTVYLAFRVVFVFIATWERFAATHALAARALTNMNRIRQIRLLAA